MYETVQAVLNSEQKTDLQQLINSLKASGKNYFLRNEILQTFADYCQESEKPNYFYHSSSLGQLVNYTHEIILEDNYIWFLVRPRIASQQVWRISPDLSNWEQEEQKVLLDLRDRLVNSYQPRILELDFAPFYENSPVVNDARNIGQGLAVWHRHLHSQITTNPNYWLESLWEILQRHQYDDIPLLINEQIKSGTELLAQVKQALNLISERPANEPYEKFNSELQALGFEPGWGNTASRVRETFALFQRLIDNPDPAILEAFVARIPSVFRVVLISVHGWVGQEEVLGRPETAGQVVYVLNQARNLENRLTEEIKQAGLECLGIKPQVTILTRLIPNCEGTKCNLRLEKITDTENAWILRVPFREFNSKVTQNWIRKFEIWPYLETFALDAEQELLQEMGGKPNLIIGNYSDGNLVAFLLASRLKVTQCNIAHSLEKPKYLFSNLYWQDLEEEYHFSAQFTADLISMNAADFIITSSFQEIVGTPDTIGQYESYNCFTMPHLYHVVHGVNLFSPKFNVVVPGVDEKFFFPYNQTENRSNEITKKIKELLFISEDSQVLGHLENADKQPIFALAPINSIKNLAGLAECFGMSKELQERCNLILVTSKLHSYEANNPEEAREIERLHEIIQQYQLYGCIRWLGMRLPNAELGEVYRSIADAQGIFVHFARFEAFGMTILEAMISGLPTFATQFGGALEIIQDGESGFLINPTDLLGTAEKIVNFLDRCTENSQYWEQLSEKAIQRVRNEFNWELHTTKVLSIAKISQFWNYISRDSKEALQRYLEALFFLIYKPRAEIILEQHQKR
ncbi:sucrose synthase [Floridanema evergladense]|uniref:Sucrose synthase n=1 Tax=Floridaenema evergladense BLCC-F167 TaxID=3153639 RepID=A0ABV4WV71_9CYAN